MDEINEDVPKIVWMRTKDAFSLCWEGNKKRHDIDDIKASLIKYGIQELPKLDDNIGIKAGNGRIETLFEMEKAGEERPRGIREDNDGNWLVPIIAGVNALSENEAIAYAVDSNNIGMTGMTEEEKSRQWDDGYLEILAGLEEAGDRPVSVGDEVTELLEMVGDVRGKTPVNRKDGVRQGDKGIVDVGLSEMPVPVELQKKWGVQVWDIWELGEHRLICGDSTDPVVVERLFAGDKAVILHADPPYPDTGRTNAAAQMDIFQMAWWDVAQGVLVANASAYVWGWANDLWRLWYRHLEGTKPMSVRNEIVWDKGSVIGMGSDAMTKYPSGSFRCLFIQIGEQHLSETKGDYWSGWDEIRIPLKEEADNVGLTPKLLEEVCGVGMYGHWFRESQWVLIPPEHYATLQDEFPGNFLTPYEEIRGTYLKLYDEYQKHIEVKRGGKRSYFDNSHQAMYDVWRYGRVRGDERMGHPAAKPVKMAERVLKSSSRVGEITYVPFGGSGPEWVAAENTHRVVYGAELLPEFCAVILERWSQSTDEIPRKK